jgi:hypothetical protein
MMTPLLNRLPLKRMNKNLSMRMVTTFLLFFPPHLLLPPHSPHTALLVYHPLFFCHPPHILLYPGHVQV